jgi:hypothetical protein
VIQHGGAELMETAVGQLHLRLDADCPRNMPATDPVGYVAQQRTLADAGLPAQDHDLAVIGEHIGQEPVEFIALATTSEKARMWMTILARWQGRLPGLALRITGRISRYAQEIDDTSGLTGESSGATSVSGSSSNGGGNTRSADAGSRPTRT